jgi:hypothetical protein
MHVTTGRIRQGENEEGWTHAQLWTQTEPVKVTVGYTTFRNVYHIYVTLFREN